MQTLNTPLITIVTVVKNAEACLEETIKNVLSLNYKETDYVIVDGKSTDNTLDIIKTYDSQITTWISEPDNGLYDAMNKAWEIAREDSSLLFLGAGDKIVNMPSRLSCLANGHVICGRVRLGERGIFKSRANFQLRFANTLHHQSLIVPKQLHPDPPFNTAYRVYADFDFNQRLYKKGIPFVFDPSFLSDADPGGISQTYSPESYRVSLKNYGIGWAMAALIFYLYNKCRRL
ncbi:MAG: glycosyltransferase [Deltaproteobacteria bacterium]|nr:glycosyltransferase [Deltaproteobacteria bacterium]